MPDHNISNALPPDVAEALALIDQARGALTQALCRLRCDEGKVAVQVAHAGATAAGQAVRAIAVEATY